MDDPDVIAYLFAADGVNDNKALDVINMPNNKQHFLSSRQRPVDTETPSKAENLDRWQREGTELPEEKECDASMHHGPCLVFRFSTPPKTRKGIIAGCNPNVDIVINKLKGVSRYHFALTFDNQNRLVVRDLDSTIGTCVLYGSLSEHVKPGFNIDFSAEGPRLGRRSPIIKILNNLQFKLVVPPHDITSDAYRENVKRFREGSGETKDLFAGMELLSQVPTELPTPASGGIMAASKVPGKVMWTKEIGRGAFAVVYYAWDMQTRVEHALKKPLPEDSRNVKQIAFGNLQKHKPRFSLRTWRREAEILKRLRHRNIVQLKYCIIPDGGESLEEPELYFEYVPNGCLLDFVGKATTFQQEQATFQILSALAYLHGQLPEPIVHRDVKLENVLVQDWGPYGIHLKLGDFGLSNEGKLLQTFCGTPMYLAPEGYTQQTNKKYNWLVDIWSLGVLVFVLVGGEMPEYFPWYTNNSMAWANMVVKTMRAFLSRHPDNELLAFAIKYMVVPDHTLRRNVWQCLDGAQWLKGVAQTECAGSPDESESLEHSDDVDDGHESEPGTPKALQLTDRDHLVSSNKSTIQGLIHRLGERGDEAVDALVGMAPSSSSSFEHGFINTPEAEHSTNGDSTPVPAQSTIGSNMWEWRVLDGKEVTVEETCSDGVKWSEGGQSRPSFEALLREMTATSSVTTSTRLVSQSKRSFWDVNDKKSEISSEEPVVDEFEKADTSGQTSVSRPCKKTKVKGEVVNCKPNASGEGRSTLGAVHT